MTIGIFGMVFVGKYSTKQSNQYIMTYLNTKQLIETLSGSNKTFIKKADKTQSEKYGNHDIFQCWIDAQYNEIEIHFGDYSLTFYFRCGKLVDTLGNGQGSKYHKSLEKCAIELAEKYLPKH